MSGMRLSTRNILRFMPVPAACLVAAAACAMPSADENVVSAESNLDATDIRAKDLAVAFSLTSTELIGFRDSLGAGQSVFPSAWYDAVARAFVPTDVGNALTVESQASDWRVVSFRVVPCAPLGPTPSSDVERVCWPEVRVVYQPILRNVRIHERSAEAFADDRAIHAIYPVPVSTLGADGGRSASSFLSRIRTYSKAYRGGAFAPLSAAELTQFAGLRDRASRMLLQDARSLRGTSYAASAFDKVAVRPESDDAVVAQRGLRTRVLGLFSKYARPTDLAEMTAFSLPEGREPAGLDTWVFLGFSMENGRLTPAPLTVRSPTHGQQLLNLGAFETVSTASGDPRTQAALNAPGANPELRETVIGTPKDLARLSGVLSDRSRRLVPNTTCASCHMSNGIRFDFHNFGYLEDRDLTVAPRVERDVVLDLTAATKLMRAPR
jgi:hypothetical protein